MKESLMHWEMWVICSLLYQSVCAGCTWELWKTERMRNQPLLVMMMLHCSLYMRSSVWDIGRQIKSQCVSVCLFCSASGAEPMRWEERKRQPPIWTIDLRNQNMHIASADALLHTRRTIISERCWNELQWHFYSARVEHREDELMLIVQEH